MERIPRPSRVVLAASVTLAAAAALLGSWAGEAGAARSSETAPALSVSIATPADGARVKGAVRVAASASARDGVARVEFRVDGVLRWTARTAPYVLNGERGTWRTTDLANGRHTLSATAFDRRGRRARDTHVVTVANPVVAPPAAPEPAPAARAGPDARAARPGAGAGPGPGAAPRGGAAPGARPAAGPRARARPAARPRSSARSPGAAGRAQRLPVARGQRRRQLLGRGALPHPGPRLPRRRARGGGAAGRGQLPRRHDRLRLRQERRRRARGAGPRAGRGRDRVRRADGARPSTWSCAT